jgi:hypothetical protein
VLQLAMLWPMLFALGALHRYFARPSYARAVVIGVWVVVALFTSEYYAFFLLVALVVATLVYVVRPRLHFAQLGHAAAALGVMVVVAGPFVAAQSSHVADYQWPEATVASLGANASDWFRLQARALGSSFPFIGDTHGTQLALFPGAMLLLLAYFGLAGARRSQLRWIIAMLVLGITGAVLAYGLGLHLFGAEPYALLRDHVAGFARIRSPFRWAVLTQMCIALLAGLGLDAVWRWHRRLGPVLAVAFAVLAVVEVAQLPAPTATAIRGEHDDWIDYLRAQPSEPIAMVPFPPGPTEVDYSGTTLSMLLGLDVEQPMVNGYSGFFPSDYVELRKQMRGFPSDDTVAALGNFDVRWIVVENAWLTPARRARMVRLGFAEQPAFAGRDRSVYAMPH